MFPITSIGASGVNSRQLQLFVARVKWALHTTTPHGSLCKLYAPFRTTSYDITLRGASLFLTVELLYKCNVFLCLVNKDQW